MSLFKSTQWHNGNFLNPRYFTFSRYDSHFCFWHVEMLRFSDEIVKWKKCCVKSWKLEKSSRLKLVLENIRVYHKLECNHTSENKRERKWMRWNENNNKLRKLTWESHNGCERWGEDVNRVYWVVKAESNGTWALKASATWPSNVIIIHLNVNILACASELWKISSMKKKLQQKKTFSQVFCQNFSNVLEAFNFSSFPHSQFISCSLKLQQQFVALGESFSVNGCLSCSMEMTMLSRFNDNKSHKSDKRMAHFLSAATKFSQQYSSGKCARELTRAI